MKVYERLAEAFAGESITTIFGLMGSANEHWVDALDKRGVKWVGVRHEGVGLGMADGWGRATRTPGVCATTQGPGVTQLATALVTANRARSPVVAFVGECAASDHENAQWLDQGRFAEGCETGFVRLASPETADGAVRRAFHMARVESRPIMLSAPLDIQKKEYDADEPYVPSTALLAGLQAIMPPDASKLAQAADIVAASRKPVVLVGRGAMESGAGDAVIRLAQRIGAIITTTLRAKTWLAEDEYHVGVSGTYSTYTAIKLFEEADCVIAVGAGLNKYTTTGGFLYPNARFVHIDSQRHVMMHGTRGADCYVQADARLGIEALESLLATRAVKITGYRSSEVKKRLAHNFADPAEFPIEPGLVDPREVVRMLDEVVPTSVALTTSSGASGGFTSVLFTRPGRPLFLGPHFFGCVGQGLPAAMGACMATGNKPMMLVDGDISFMMHIGDWDTAVRCNLPLLVVVLNDEGLGAEYHHMRAGGKKAELALVPSPDLGVLSRGFGARGVLARSVEEVRAAVTEWLANPGPMVIDVRISREVLALFVRRQSYGREE